MNKQTIPTIKKSLLLDWLYQQKTNVPVSDLIKFIKSYANNPNIVIIDHKKEK